MTGAELATIRKAAGLSQTDLARGQTSSGLDPDYITFGGKLAALYI